MLDGKRRGQLTILAPTSINLSIGTIARAQDRPMMTLVHLLFFTRIKIVHSDPGIFCRASYESIAEEWVK